MTGQPAPVVTLIDGRPAESVSVADRALHYGDGLFETIAVRDGIPQLWPAHMARLVLGCERLGLPAPDGERLFAEAAGLCRDHERAVLKLIYTAGEGPRGYARPTPRPRRILQLSAAPAHPENRWRDGVTARFCALRLASQPALAGVKHLNRLEQVLARRECDAHGTDEGLLADASGRVVEAVTSNLFVVRDNRLVTPTIDDCGVRGVMRGRLLEIAGELGLAAEEGRLAVADITAADEVFLCNSLIGLWPVTRLDGHTWPVGPVSRRLLAELVSRRESLAPEI